MTIKYKITRVMKHGVVVEYNENNITATNAVLFRKDDGSLMTQDELKTAIEAAVPTEILSPTARVSIYDSIINIEHSVKNHQYKSL